MDFPYSYNFHFFTLKDCPNSYVTGDDLALVGFWYAGEADWNPGDEPYEEHRILTPDCPVVVASSCYPSDTASPHTVDAVRLLYPHAE